MVIENPIMIISTIVVDEVYTLMSAVKFMGSGGGGSERPIT